MVLRDYNCPLNPDKGNTSMVLFEGACVECVCVCVWGGGWLGLC